MSVRLRVLGIALTSCMLALGCSTSAAGPGEPENVAATESTVTTGAEVSAEISSDHLWHSRRESLVQFGTLDQLNRAVLDGTTPVREIERSGDFGVGTYNALDGEMIVLDGVVYRFTSDGVLRVANRNDLAPFAAVTTFRPDQHFAINQALTGYPALQASLSNSIPDQSRMFAIKVHGTFSAITTRAPHRQVKPYPTLAEAVKTQAVFNNTNIRGTLVGFRLPAYLGTTNATGYHFHFVSDNHQVGGHVLDVSVNWATVEVEALEHLQVNVPEDD